MCTGLMPSNTSSVLSKDEILKAEYTIKANFSGEIPTQKIIFPVLNNEIQKPQGLTGTIFAYSDGTSSASLIGGKDYEAFWIYKYELNPNNLEAMVYINGNFVGEGNDNRTFLVSKVKGKVIAEEQTNKNN